MYTFKLYEVESSKSFKICLLLKADIVAKWHSLEEPLTARTYTMKIYYIFNVICIF